MASTHYPSTVQSDSVRAAIAEIKSLTVDKLKKVLRGEVLTVGGIKSELQVRLIGHVERCAAMGDYARIERMRTSIKGATQFSNPYPSPYSNHTPNASLSPQFVSPTPRQPPPMPPQNVYPYMPNRVTFKTSPFYTISKPLCAVQELKVREQTRDTARINLRLDHVIVDTLQRDPNARIMVFCAADNGALYSEPNDIAFPQHGELKCNSDEVKHNLKGMKNKPGTTRPADITQYIRKTPTFPNTIELVYALTSKKYYLVVNLVLKRPIEKLVTEIRNRRTPFLRDRVIREMRSKAEDPDIVATSTNMSLKDPLQMTRIQTPCRGVSCTHNGCFDAAVYLALQEQAPTWTCPICHKSVTWENVAFDHYFNDILQHVDNETEQVTVEPDGTWHREEVKTSDKDEGYSRNATGHNDDDDDDDHDNNDDDDDDDDDVVEIADSRMNMPREMMRTPSMMRTPPISTLAGMSALASASPTNLMPIPNTVAPTSNKRPHSETIDLTLDDSDDDQPPVSRIKRPSLSSQSSETYKAREPFRFEMPPPNTSFGSGRYTQGY